MLKVAVFRYLFWLVLVVVFVAGATRISVFGLGYLLACFYLLLFGTTLLQKETRARLLLWDCLILYNVTVIISKNLLSVSAPTPADPACSPPPLLTLDLCPQLLSCVFVEQMQSSFCWVIQLFSLVCTVKGYYDREWDPGGWGRLNGAASGWDLTPALLTAKEMMGKDQDCLLPVEEAGVLWDSVCFFFLLLQRRVFLSYYFLHVSVDLRATALQASRSASAREPSQLCPFHELWVASGDRDPSSLARPHFSTFLQGVCPLQCGQPQEHRLPPQGGGEVPGAAEATVGAAGVAAPGWRPALLWPRGTHPALPAEDGAHSCQAGEAQGEPSPPWPSAEQAGF